jgi:hypothetical protein
MIKPEWYRARADQCEREAELPRNTHIGEQLKRIAQQWRDLALMRERLDIGPDKLAELVADAGQFDWLIRKVS